MDKEVTIIGFGLAGSFFAIALDSFNIKFNIIDQLKEYKDDDRTLLITSKSKRMLDELGIWDKLSKHACPIHGVKVFEHDTPFFVDYNKSKLGIDEFGYIIEYKHVLNTLKNFKNFEIVNDKVISTKKEDNHISINLSTGKTLKSKLCVSSEGSIGTTYLNHNIQKKSFDFDHNAIIAKISHSISHENYAYEVFFENGFLAILPLTNNFESGIVMSCEKGSNLFAPDIEKKINNLFQFYGDIKIKSAISTYVLKDIESKTIHDSRYVLIGDSANVIHPLGGLGINMGWNDAYILAKHIHEAKSIGLDIGYHLNMYAKKRTIDHKMHHLAINGILNIFKSKYLKGTRRFGMSVLERIPPLKRYIIKKATG